MTTEATPSDSSKLLRDLLTAFDSDAEVECISDEPEYRTRGLYNYVKSGDEFVPPTHVVHDAEGHTLGIGLSEDEAVAAAILQVHRHTVSWLEQHKKAVQALRELRRALAEIGG